MPLRISTGSNYERVLSGLRLNLSRLVRSQEQVATGRRILRPSDDPSGTARVLGFNRQLAGTDRFINAIGLGRSVVDTGAAALETGSGILAEVRQNLIQGMNGTLSQFDRDALANEMDLLRDQMLGVANTRSGERNLFGGTQSGDAPWISQTIGGIDRAVYTGNDEEQQIRVGDGVEIGITVTGEKVFAKNNGTGPIYAGLTGIAEGVTGDEGQGYEYLTLRHDGTNSATLGASGIALVGAGASDTILGDNTLTVDVTAGTVQLGNGPAVSIPVAGSSTFADLTVENEFGGELHLDFTAFGGADFIGTVSGTGSISVDGTNFTAIDFAETDLELIHPDSGNALHVNLTGVKRAGVELAAFGGKVNVFDALQGIADDLRNGDGLDSNEITERFGVWLSEVDRGHNNLLVSLGSLGSRSERMTQTENKLQGVQLQLESLRSEELDVDISEAALDLARAQQSLELAQASGARLLQTNLLNFLR